jgi:hypothetical protein
MMAAADMVLMYNHSMSQLHNIHTCMHACMHAYIHTYIRTYIYTWKNTLYIYTLFPFISYIFLDIIYIWKNDRYHLAVKLQVHGATRNLSGLQRLGFKRDDSLSRWYFTTTWEHHWLMVWNMFSIYWEEYSQLTNIFQRGWNHQPDQFSIVYRQPLLENVYHFQLGFIQRKAMAAIAIPEDNFLIFHWYTINIPIWYIPMKYPHCTI